MVDVFLQIGIIIVAAVIIGLILRKLGQPLVLAYIFAGVILGPILNLLSTEGPIQSMSHIGIALLLFLIGVELNFNEVRHLGLISIVTGVGQFIFTFIAGYFISQALGFGSLESFFIAVVIPFSSTIIVLKLLSDKNELFTLHGRIAIGFLIVQDMIAIMIMMLLSTSNGVDYNVLGLNLIKGLLLIAGAIIAGLYALPYLFRTMARSQELLFLGSIAWAFFYATVASTLQFSVEIGAFLAGMALATSPYRLEISSRIKPLRDFFITLFFVILGSQLGISLGSDVIIPSIILSALVLFANPLIIMVLMGVFGYRKRTSFLTGLTSAQISEFSLIIIAMAFGLGYISSKVASIVTMTAIITIVISSYLITYSHEMYNKVSGMLSVFERRNSEEEKIPKVQEKNHVIVFGYHRLGHYVVDALEKLQENYVIIDYDPETEKALSKRNVPHIYGDASDPELLDSISLKNAKMIISTIPDVNDNLLIISKVKNSGNAKIVVTANEPGEAIELYDAGADYVIVPHLLGGEKVAVMLEDFSKSIKKIISARLGHIKELYDKVELSSGKGRNGK